LLDIRVYIVTKNFQNSQQEIQGLETIFVETTKHLVPGRKKHNQIDTKFYFLNINLTSNGYVRKKVVIFYDSSYGDAMSIMSKENK
jgi:hypothetical protein